MPEFNWKTIFFKKKNNNLYIILIVGILMILASNFLFTSGSGKEVKQSEKKTDETKTERRLETILASVSGVGDVDVMITYDTGKEYVTVVNRTGTVLDSTETDVQGGGRQSTESNEETETVMVNSGNESTPFISKEIEPKIRGVLIVAEGAGNVNVRMNVMNAVAAVMDVPYHRIQVLPKAK